MEWETENLQTEEINRTEEQADLPEQPAKKKKHWFRRLLFLLIAGGLLFAADRFLPVPWRKGFSSAWFRIATYKSPVDRDGDGVDDQTDILRGARKYVSRKPEYKSEFYDTGYPTGNYGVCTDVVGAALLAAGYDLMELVHEDVVDSPGSYPDRDSRLIDFRRVVNLNTWFKRNAAYTLTTDISQIGEWQGGDIVTFDGHIGIVSDRRNARGVPYVIHHGREGQKEYEENILEQRSDIVGHYRMS